MKDLDKQDDTTALMADIVQYERVIGELLERNEVLSAELAQSEQNRMTALENQISGANADLAAVQVAVMRLAAQQGKNTELIMRLLSEMVIRQAAAGAEADTGPLAETLSLSETYSHAIESILSGQSVEYLKVRRLAIEPEMALKTLRSEAVFTDALDFRGRSTLVMQEDRAKGVHALIFQIRNIKATALRGLELELLAREVPAVRIRARSTADSSNTFEVNVDLTTGYYARFLSAQMSGGRRHVMVRPLRDGWKMIQIDAALLPDEGSVEVELISLGDREARSSRRTGIGKDAFALRSLRATYSAGLTEVGTPVRVETDPEPGAPEPPATPQVVTKVHMPDQERKRAEKRAAYLASGAYGALSRLRGKHRGKRAFVIGNGPSISGQDLTLLKDEVTFVTNWFVNHPQYAEIDPSYYCVSSHEMFGGWKVETPAANPDWLEKMLAKSGGTHKFFSFAFRDYLLGQGIFPQDSCDFLLFDRPKYQVDQRGDINLDLTQPMDDGYTGIITFCLPLAHFMGIEEIYLLGCDCDYGPIKDGAPKAYFYDFSQHTTRTTSEAGLLRAWAEGGPVFQSYEIVRDRFALDGVRIMNATAGGRLEVFPRVDYESLVGGA